MGSLSDFFTVEAKPFASPGNCAKSASGALMDAQTLNFSILSYQETPVQEAPASNEYWGTRVQQSRQDAEPEALYHAI